MVILVKFWQMKFEILNPSENRNLKSLTLDHKIWILTTKISFFENWTNLMKKLTKIENLRSLTLKSKIWRNHKIWKSLNPKIQNFQFRQNLTKNQNSATVVYHNFAISPKWRKSKFSKICPNMGEQRVTKFFKILKSISKSPKSPKLALITKIF